MAKVDSATARRIRVLHKVCAVTVAGGCAVVGAMGGVDFTTRKNCSAEDTKYCSFGFQEALLQWYMCIFSVMSILGEFQMTFILKILGLLRSYFGRALFYTLIASLGILFFENNRITFGAGIVMASIGVWTFGLSCTKMEVEEEDDGEDDEEDSHGSKPAKGAGGSSKKSKNKSTAHEELDDGHDDFGEDEPGTYNSI